MLLLTATIHDNHLRYHPPIFGLADRKAQVPGRALCRMVTGGVRIVLRTPRKVGAHQWKASQLLY